MASELPIDLYNVDAVRALDATAIERGKISGLSLMRRAGLAAFKALRLRWPEAVRIAVVCGQGNNAGDGYVVATFAREAGLEVTLVQVGEVANLSVDATACRDAAIALGVRQTPAHTAIEDAELVVDAIFGIGLRREVDGSFATAIAAINQCGAPVLSIDIPSGINANTGCRMGVSVQASATVTFIGLKQGLVTADGPQACGEVIFDTLGVPQWVYDEAGPNASLCSIGDATTMLGPRSRTAHKGHNGHVLLVGGTPGYGGAIRLAGEAAARVGAGLISVATDPRLAESVGATRPELMVHGVTSAAALKPLLTRANVVGIGPGLGQSSWAMQLFATVVESGLPMVVDADALNLLASEPMRCEHWVLTPHPGEAARMLQCTTEAIHSDRFAAAAALQSRYGGSVILKGAGSIITDGTDVAVLGCGNPGMGSGGMGDVLTGVVAGLIAQDWCLAHAAKVGACVHSTAADLAAGDGERGLIASDLMVHLRYLVN